jgi:hypothetical protein
MKNFMRLLKVSTLALPLYLGVAHAQSFNTLEAAQAGFLAARQNGDLPMGFAAKTEREVFYGNRTGTGAGSVQPAAANARVFDPPLGFAAKTQSEIYGGNFAKSDPSVTRAQVRAQLFAARKAGDLPVGFAGRTEREVFGPVRPQSVVTRQVAGAPSAQAR